jgi:hypothetical protein
MNSIKIDPSYLYQYLEAQRRAQWPPRSDPEKRARAQGIKVTPAENLVEGIHPRCPPRALETTRAPPMTPVRVDIFEHLLRAHPNRPLVTSVMRQMRVGHDSLCRNVTDEFLDTHLASSCDNYGSATSNPEAAKKGFTDNLAKGYALPTACDVVLSPTGLMEKGATGKFRTITDLTASGVNGLIERDAAKTENPSVADILDLMVACGPDMAATTFDLENAYSQLPIHPQHRFLLGTHYDGQSAVATTCPFKNLVYGAHRSCSSSTQAC